VSTKVGTVSDEVDMACFDLMSTIEGSEENHRGISGRITLL
jgi:hypothetical protein